MQGLGILQQCLLQNNEKIMLRSKNKLIAGFDGVKFRSNRIKIKAPSTLYIYSDGAYEVKKEDGKMYTFGEMIDYLISYANDKGCMSYRCFMSMFRTSTPVRR
jgi:serine phosphatase RsbU (regulator of sigma subunit)